MREVIGDDKELFQLSNGRYIMSEELSDKMFYIKANRKFIGMELDEKYFETAQKRLEKAEKELYSSR